MYIQGTLACYVPDGYFRLIGIPYNDEDDAKIPQDDKGDHSDALLPFDNPTIVNPGASSSNPTHRCGSTSSSTSMESYMQQITTSLAIINDYLTKILQEFHRQTTWIDALYEQLDQSSNSGSQPPVLFTLLIFIIIYLGFFFFNLWSCIQLDYVFMDDTLAYIFALVITSGCILFGSHSYCMLYLGTFILVSMYFSLI